MNVQFIAIIQKLITEQGKDTLLNATKCKAFLSDYTGTEYQKERRLFTQAIEAGVGKAISSAPELELCKKLQVRHLTEEFFLVEEMAADVVETLALLLRGDTASVRDASKPVKKPQAAASDSAQAAGKTCPKCGEAVEADWEVCPFCEADLTVQELTCSSCGKPLKSGWKTCPWCKTPVGRIAENGAEAYISRAEAYVDEKEYDKAVAELTEGVRVFPDNDQLLSGRAICFLIYIEDYDKALADINAAIRLNSVEAEYYNIRGRILGEKGDPDAALRDYNKAIQLEPSGDVYFYFRGKLFAEVRDDFDSALKDYTQAIQLDSDDIDYYIARGEVYVKMENYDRAIADYTQAIRINSDNAYIYNSRGMAYRLQEDYATAIADYTTAIQLVPDYTDAFFGRGLAYYNDGDYDHALKDFTKVIQLDNVNDSAFYFRGLTYKLQHEYALAVNDLSKSIELDPDFGPAYSNRGFAYYMMDDYNAAIKDYKKAIQLDPDDADLYYFRGESYRFQKRYDAAIQDYNMAIKRDGNDYFYWQGLAKAFSGKENYTAAVSHYRKAITLYSNRNDATREELAELYNGRGVASANNQNKAMALADFEMAIQLDPNESQYQENRKQVKGSDCFITTAVCDSLGKADNCYELTAFRNFRDNWLIYQPEGKQIVDEYYRVAPNIVARINKNVGKDEVYSDIWNNHLLPCLRLIENGAMEECKERYMDMIYALKYEWYR